MLQSALGLLGDIEGELEALRVETFYLALHPGVKRFVGLLSIFLGAFFVQETLDFLGVLHLLAVILQLQFCHGFADWRAAQLLEDLGDLADGQVALESPILFALGVAADCRGLVGLVSVATCRSAQ